MIATRLLFTPWLILSTVFGGALWFGVGAAVVAFDIAHKRHWSPWKFGGLLLLALLILPDLFTFLGASNGK